MSDTLAIGYVHPGQVDAHFMQSVVNLVVDDAHRQRPRILHGGALIAVGSGPRIAAARNEVVESFLSTTADWLLMLDTDMVFSVEAVNKIMDAADPVNFPLLGGLCFGGGRSGIMFPTMYRLRQAEENQSPFETIEDYPDDALCKVDATGAAFLLMHRSVLAKMGEVYGDTPYPWFLEGSSYRGAKFGEDWAFCLRAKEAGFPLYVHTGCKIGHVKPQVLDEDTWLAFKAKKAEIGEAGVAQVFKEKIMGAPKAAPVKAPTYVVIPQKGKVGMTCRLLGQLAQQKDVAGIYVFDNGSTPDEVKKTREAAERCGAEVVLAEGKTIHEMWNEGVGRVFKDVPAGPVNIAVLNNDLRIGPHFLVRQATALRADHDLVAVCPNYDERKGSGVQYVEGTWGNRGMSGFAFMFKGEVYRQSVVAGTPVFDEGLHWWYGDDDFACEIIDSGKRIGFVYGASVEHLDGGSQTAKDTDLNEIIAQDRAYFMAKHSFIEREDGALIRERKEAA